MQQEILPPLPAPPASEPADDPAIDPDNLPEELEFTPVEQGGKRWSGISAHKQRLFIAHLLGTGAVSMAAKAAGHTTSAFYQLRKRAGAASFAAAWDKAVEAGARRVADLLMEYAIYGVPETWSSQGRATMERRRPHLRAMQHIVGAHLPESVAGTLAADGVPSTAVPHGVRRLKDRWRKDWEAERQAEEREHRLEYNRKEAAQATEADDRLRTIRTFYQRAISHDPVKRAAWDMLTGPGTDWDAVRAADAYLNPQKHEWHMYHPDIVIPLAAGAGLIDIEDEEGGDLTHAEWHPPEDDPDGSRGESDEIWFARYADHIVEGELGESDPEGDAIAHGDARLAARTLRDRAEAWQQARPPVLDRPYGLPRDVHMSGGPTSSERDRTRRRAERDIERLEREYAAAYSEESWAAWKAGGMGGGADSDEGADANDAPAGAAR